MSPETVTIDYRLLMAGEYSTFDLYSSMMKKHSVWSLPMKPTEWIVFWAMAVGFALLVIIGFTVFLWLLAAVVGVAS